MNPVLLQKQLKENSADLNDFYKELKAWGEDMKRKEESLKSNNNLASTEKRKDVPKKKKKVDFTQPEVVKVKSRITDYSAWENFDVEAECEKIDYNENEESDLTDECDETVRDEAYLQKEKGNKFVKDKKWDEAISCYNKAINYYSYDPIFYANRALCFLKKEDFVKAELDCTMSLKLDATYVKALQRRAASREALGKLEEAESDLLKVLELEPKNKETQNNLESLRKKFVNQKPVEKPHPISKFTASRNKKNNTKNAFAGIKEATVNTASLPSKQVDQRTREDIILVKAVKKPIHMQSKKPLKRIEIQETVGIIDNIITEETQSLPKPAFAPITFKTDDLKVIEKKLEQPKIQDVKENKNQTNMKINESPIQLNAPVNSVQFYSQWRQLKTLDMKYAYLKIIKPENLPTIFQESLESNIFSEVIELLAKCFIKDNLGVFDFLKFFSEMKRFSTLILFMTDTDKNYLRQLFDYARHHEDHPNEQIDLLVKKYEL